MQFDISGLDSALDDYNRGGPKPETQSCLARFLQLGACKRGLPDRLPVKSYRTTMPWSPCF